MARIFGLRESNCANYYYGKCFPVYVGYTLIRRGACVDLWGMRLLINTNSSLIMLNQLEMLTAREQLMEDIDAIVDEFTFDLPIDDIHERSQLAEDLTRILCDAVCKNFPTK